MPRSPLRAASLAALVTLAVAAPAVAQPEPAKPQVADSRLYFNAGARAYAAGKYLAAVRAFEEAYRIEPRPGLVFSIAQAYRRQYFLDKSNENLARAIQHYRKYLALDPDGARRGDTAEALSELEPLSSKLTAADVAATPAPRPATQLMISSPVDEVTITLDGKSAGLLPYIAGVTPGVHHVVLQAKGYLDYRRDVRVLDGSVVPLDVTLQEKPARLTVAAPEGARISIDGRFRGVAPAPPIGLPAGRHFVTVTKNGHEAFSREIAVERDEARSLHAELHGTTQRTASWLLLGIGGTAVLAGGGLLAAALAHENTAESMDITTKEDIRAYNDAIESRDELRTAGFVTAGSGLAIAAIGGFLFAFDEPRVGSVTAPEESHAPARPRREQRPGLDVSASPWFSPDAAGAVVRGSF